MKKIDPEMLKALKKKPFDFSHADTCQCIGCRHERAVKVTKSVRSTPNKKDQPQ
jgi:hypothetical protein